VSHIAKIGVKKKRTKLINIVNLRLNLNRWRCMKAWHTLNKRGPDLLLQAMGKIKK
jgi:hypothetical protein